VSGEGQEELFQLGHAHGKLVAAILGVLTVAQSGRDNLETGAVECLGNGGDTPARKPFPQTLTA
jgi:hypothetical protein